MYYDAVLVCRYFYWKYTTYGCFLSEIFSSAGNEENP